MQVVTLQPLTVELPSVDIAFQSHTNGNGRSSHAAAKKHAQRTAVKALNIMQHIYRLPKVSRSTPTFLQHPGALFLLYETPEGQSLAP